MKTETQHIIVCAWCGSLMRQGTPPISHGICGHCSSRIKEEHALLLKPDEPWRPEDHQGRRLDQFLYSAWIVGSCILTGAIVIAAAILTAFL